MIKVAAGGGCLDSLYACAAADFFEASRLPPMKPR
jgi:hypothetical protein